MSLRENMMDSPPADRSQTSKPDNKQPHRLYPSLPDIDGYEICVPQEIQTAAESDPERRLGDAQPEESVASGDVRMKAQILILEEQRHELISINEKWAKEYRTMVRYYKEKVQDLKALLQNHSHFEERTREDGDKHVTSCKKLKFKTLKDEDSKWAGDGDTSSELLKAEEAARELRAQNSSLTRRGRHQHEEIKRLNKALEEALQSAQPLEASSETLQDLWKHQAEVYKEDFLTERKDREKLKEKYLELENRYRKAHSELHVLKSQTPRTQAAKPALECACASRAKRPIRDVRPADQHRAQLQRRFTLGNKL